MRSISTILLGLGAILAAASGYALVVGAKEATANTTTFLGVVGAVLAAFALMFGFSTRSRGKRLHVASANVAAWSTQPAPARALDADEVPSIRVCTPAADRVVVRVRRGIRLRTYAREDALGALEELARELGDVPVALSFPDETPPRTMRTLLSLAIDALRTSAK